MYDEAGRLARRREHWGPCPARRPISLRELHREWHVPDKKKPRHPLTDFWVSQLRTQKALRDLASQSAVGTALRDAASQSTVGSIFRSSGDAYREAFREVYGTDPPPPLEGEGDVPQETGFAVERFRELATLEVQKNPEGARFQIGTVWAQPGTYLYRVWEDPVLCDAFIEGEKLRALVLSSASPTPLAIRQSGIVRPTPKDENAQPQEGRIQEWQQLLDANRLAFEEALARAISAYRAEVTRPQSLTTAPKGDRQPPISEAGELAECPRERLLQAYLAQFDPKPLIKDICWAAHVDYDNFKKWRRATRFDDGSSIDKSLRRVLGTSKHPLKLRPRPQA